ncbi:putative mitochondrial heat shock protein [Leptomonas pyrrhocoris]|uniref:Putative mitochondrial heat shock protein n=1 Tax=Leptomonas pyrrhocoris TaxID=157538 RepID=A0A0M9FT69_LEPPY|nr:putative mitochondrial heat shock protein [Leptomonas pyrrhocoris]KPA75565.1 putative mitochondrial heat shock protein [Leptomonas pyrrhocoris]|eukprot:XP_015654004.1 putative mitochondrial heat shock protein [Leptomonas pyrrhocoris]
MLPRSCSGVLYEVLELDRQCTSAEVSQQYRRLALRYHPDRNAGATVEQFQQIEEAHRVLSNPQQRRLYDTVGREGLKQLGDYSGGMLGSLLIIIGNVAAGCFIVGLLSAAFFVSLLVGCYKIDAPDQWPSWGVILLPLWCFLPGLVVASVAVMVESWKRGLYVLLLPSVRLLLCVVIVATSAAALDHRMSPISAFIPWIIWYVIGTVSDIVMMVPTVYRRVHSPHFSEEAASGTTNATQEPFLPGGAHNFAVPSPSTATNDDHRGSPAGSENGSFATTPWRTGQYWRDLAELLLEAGCVYAFIALAFQRALQQQKQQQQPAAPGPVLSFWVVLAPLLVFFGVHFVVNAWEGFFAPSSVPNDGHGGGDSASASPLNASTPFRDGSHRTSSGGSSVSSSSAQQQQQQQQSQRPPGLGERAANVLLRTGPPACGLYMSAMWAAKAEYEYNGVTTGADPSAFLAFLPILVVLGALAFSVCCGGCLIVCLGRTLTSAGEDGAAGQQAAHSPAQRSSGRNTTTLARDEGYQSTAASIPPTQGSPGAARSLQMAAPHLAPRRGNTASDLAIEQID